VKSDRRAIDGVKVKRHLKLEVSAMQTDQEEDWCKLQLLLLVAPRLHYHKRVLFTKICKACGLLWRNLSFRRNKRSLSLSVTN